MTRCDEIRHEIHGAFDLSYPAGDIEKMWKLVCLNQFHDCLPGSAIEIAYDDVHKVYMDALQYETLDGL